MVDPLDAEYVECAPHVLRRSLFARVRNQMKTLIPCQIEDTLEIFRREPDLGRVEPDTQQQVAIREDRLECPHRFPRSEMAQEAENQPR